MMKRKGLICFLVLAVCMLLAGFAAAETDPIVTSMELSPNKLVGPGPVSVTITISNSGDTDLQDPVVLYDPAAQIVSDFGTNGTALLKAGETVTWTGTYDVNQRTLDNGFVVYYVKYTLYNDSGKAVAQSQSIRQEIGVQTVEADMDVERTISPTIASEGQKVVVRYSISNSGTIALVDVGIQEHEDIYAKKQVIPRLEVGQTADIEYPVVMGKKDLTSGATITFKSDVSSEEQTYTVEQQTITYGEPVLEAELATSAKGVVKNGVITLTLTLKNTGSVDYSDIRVTDAALGDVFTNQELKAGKTLELTKEVTVPESMDYQFTVFATDASGTETSVATEAVSISAIDPADALTMDVVATPDKTEVFEQPGHVRFTLNITNTSNVTATDVTVSHGETKLYTFAKIGPGETRTLSRDFALSMAGKYRFTVTAKDALDAELSFDSNETQIAFSVPTPAPATPTPRPQPTPEPTFAAATIPSIYDRSIGTVPKFIQSILLPVLIVVGVVLIGTCVLLLIATKRRHDQKKASEAAVDQLERAKRRDYITPAEEQEEPVQEEPMIDTSALDDPEEEEYELPHMKYARSARPAEVENPDQPADGYAYDGYEPQEDDGQPGWEPLYDEPVYPEDTQEDDQTGNAAAYDDSAFRRPGRRSRAGRGNDVNA